MKYILLLIASFGVWTLSAQEKSYDSPVQYLEELSIIHNDINVYSMDYLQHSVHSSDYTLIAKKRNSLIEKVNKGIQILNNTGSYQGDDHLRQEMLAVLKMFQESFRIEFDRADLLKQGSQESFEAMESYYAAVEAAEMKLEEAGQRLRQAQKEFASKYHVTLVEDGQSDVLDLSKLNAYQRKIFLRQFKLTKLNDAFMHHLQNSNWKEAEKARAELLQAALKESTELKKLPAYKMYPDYRDAAIELADMFSDLANRDYLTMLNIYEKGVSSQDDVDTINALVEKLNVSIPQALQKFHSKYEELMKKFIPEPRATKKI